MARKSVGSQNLCSEEIVLNDVRRLRLFIWLVPLFGLNACMDDVNWQAIHDSLGSTYGDSPPSDTIVQSSAPPTGTDLEEASLGPKAYDQMIREQNNANTGKH